jgi:hypothetical protein
VKVRLTVALLTLALLAAACGGSTTSAATSPGARKGVLELTSGACTGGSPTGSWFRMVQSGGSPGSGPYVANGDSQCNDKTVTLLAPGTDGGLRVGAYQPQPDPPFGKDGASLAAGVIKPAVFFAVPFGISTNPMDPQTGRKVPVPSITIAGKKLTADLTAVSVSWNGQHFNQGAPKPGGDGDAAGTYDEATRRYTLDWTSVIKGGPFNGFIGVWHFEGAFRASA